ncbi:hypothetical protein BDZ89DRAFT_1073933 [Hymenopellis radicata]|nr:hypothetical protein BDZ89DRAFT_1073933 [Hymenopellis radicata]
MDESQQHIVIIGAGGICMGIALRRELHGFDDFTAFDIGGTWQNDTYPLTSASTSTLTHVCTHTPPSPRFLPIGAL